VTAGVLAAGAQVAGVAVRGDTGEDAGDDGRARECFVRTADDGEREAGTVATAAWKGRPAHESAASGAAGSQPGEVVAPAVTCAAAEAGAGPAAWWRAR
jgi:hypothetical protein